VVLTAPADAVKVEEKEIYLLPGGYQVERAADRRGIRLVRFYTKEEDTDLIVFAADGFVVQDAFTGEIDVIAAAEGHSRSGRHGDRWSLIVAKIGSIVAIQPYESIDPKYYRVSLEGLVLLGESDAVLPPEEW
jgi:hypothetical protein